MVFTIRKITIGSQQSGHIKMIEYFRKLSLMKLTGPFLNTLTTDKLKSPHSAVSRRVELLGIVSHN